MPTGDPRGFTQRVLTASRRVLGPTEVWLESTHALSQHTPDMPHSAPHGGAEPSRLLLQLLPCSSGPASPRAPACQGGLSAQPASWEGLGLEVSPPSLRTLSSTEGTDAASSPRALPPTLGEGVAGPWRRRVGTAFRARPAWPPTPGSGSTALPLPGEIPTQEAPAWLSPCVPSWCKPRSCPSSFCSTRVVG